MAVKIDISKLNDLRNEVGRLLAEAQEMWEAGIRVVAGASFTTPVVIVFRDNILMVCYRNKKIEGGIEVSRISKGDGEEGPTPKRLDMHMARIAKFLEKRGLYQERGAITGKTPSLFELPEKAQKI